MVEVRKRQTQVVNGGADRAPRRPHHVEKQQLIADIQVVGGLVQKNKVRILRQSAGQHRSTTLPAGKLVTPVIDFVRQADDL